jgi:hypothetical protein
LEWIKRKYHSHCSFFFCKREIFPQYLAKGTVENNDSCAPSVQSLKNDVTDCMYQYGGHEVVKKGFLRENGRNIRGVVDSFILSIGNIISNVFCKTRTTTLMGGPRE